MVKFSKPLARLQIDICDQQRIRAAINPNFPSIKRDFPRFSFHSLVNAMASSDFSDQW